MEYTVGQVAYSKSGHDKGDAFVIFDAEGEYVYLVDGKNRRIEKPKKKKLKHVQFTNYIDYELQAKIMHREQLLDSDFAKAIKKYSSQNRAK
ncbi:MAG: KOW domain-containing RNA-binding protein [Clostridiales bacterium]|nr:KOW domain-containing RNA-binding protein [Clostridiales bacterium]